MLIAKPSRFSGVAFFMSCIFGMDLVNLLNAYKYHLIRADTSVMNCCSMKKCAVPATLDLRHSHLIRGDKEGCLKAGIFIFFLMNNPSISLYYGKLYILKIILNSRSLR